MAIEYDQVTKPTDSPEKVDLPLSREDLYALVWAEPMLKVAARFDVSSSYMARVCTRMNVPRPERGYSTTDKRSIARSRITLLARCISKYSHSNRPPSSC